MSELNRNTLWYFDLESVKNRYTHQLCNEWMPYGLSKFKPVNFDIIQLQGEQTKEKEIKHGVVLDATSRCIYSMQQIQKFLEHLEKGNVKDGDIIFLQDFWTPGIESIFYSLDIYGIKVKLYSMLHAQSVDEYDFTYSMRNWMRFYELGLDARSTGIFVGSTIHKQQLIQAGFKSPIHVVSLPYGYNIEKDKKRGKLQPKKKNQVVFSSRFDYEKNIMFMLEVAERFLQKRPNWEWVITTSAKKVRSNDPLINEYISNIPSEGKLRVASNLTKEEYYEHLAESKIQFNSSLQDYVSWTIIEATAHNCDVVFPDFRSFPEILPKDRLYTAFDVEDAVQKLVALADINENEDYYKPNFKRVQNIPKISQVGLFMECYIIFNDFFREINIWQETEYCTKFIESFLNKKY